MRSIWSLLLAGIAGCLLSSCAQSSSHDDQVVSQTYVHKYGVAVPEHDWTARGEHGQVVSMLKNGVIVTRSYSGGILEGETTYTFPFSSSIEKIETYAQNMLDKEVYLYISGSPMQETRYLADGGRSVTSWYENSVPRSNEKYDAAGLLVSGEYTDIHNHLDARVINQEGTRLTRDSEGQLISQDTIVQGQMTICTTFYPNKAIKEIVPLQNGIVEGELRTFLLGGEPNTVEQWVGGKQDGITLQFQNGELFAELHYSNGRKNGLERHFRDGHIVLEEISWKDDVRHGPSKIYIGSSEQTEWYHQGSAVSPANFEILNRGSKS